MTPPIAIIGAVITMVSIMMSICCTWVVSLVVRVTSEAEPKRSNWWIDKLLDPREDRAAQDPAESGRDLRRVVAAGDGAQRGDDRHQQHQAADLEDGALVAPDDALVDDVRHQARQEQGADRLRQGQHQHDRDVAAVGLEETEEFQHVGGEIIGWKTSI